MSRLGARSPNIDPSKPKNTGEKSPVKRLRDQAGLERTEQVSTSPVKKQDSDKVSKLQENERSQKDIQTKSDRHSTQFNFDVHADDNHSAELAKLEKQEKQIQNFEKELGQLKDLVNKKDSSGFQKVFELIVKLKNSDSISHQEQAARLLENVKKQVISEIKKYEAKRKTLGLASKLDINKSSQGPFKHLEALKQELKGFIENDDLDEDAVFDLEDYYKIFDRALLGIMNSTLGQTQVILKDSRNAFNLRQENFVAKQAELKQQLVDRSADTQDQLVSQEAQVRDQDAAQQEQEYQKILDLYNQIGVATKKALLAKAKGDNEKFIEFKAQVDAIQQESQKLIDKNKGPELESFLAKAGLRREQIDEVINIRAIEEKVFEQEFDRVAEQAKDVVNSVTKDIRSELKELRSKENLAEVDEKRIAVLEQKLKDLEDFAKKLNDPNLLKSKEVQAAVKELVSSILINDKGEYVTKDGKPVTEGTFEQAFIRAIVPEKEDRKKVYEAFGGSILRGFFKEEAETAIQFYKGRIEDDTPSYKRSVSLNERIRRAAEEDRKEALKAQEVRERAREERSRARAQTNQARERASQEREAVQEAKSQEVINEQRSAEKIRQAREAEAKSTSRIKDSARELIDRIYKGGKLSYSLLTQVISADDLIKDASLFAIFGREIVENLVESHKLVSYELVKQVKSLSEIALDPFLANIFRAELLIELKRQYTDRQIAALFPGLINQDQLKVPFEHAKKSKKDPWADVV